MVRALGLVLLLFPVVAAAGVRSPEVALLREKSSEQVTVPFDGERVRVIVEFAAAPLARVPSRLRTEAAEDVRSTLARFRRDLTASIASESSRRVPPVIVHEYLNASAGAAVTLDPNAVAAIRRLPYVARVTYDVAVHASIEPGVIAVRAPEVWSSLGTRGAGVTVAIIDSGVDYMHPALGGGLGPQYKVIGGYDFVNEDADPMDDNAHGTHVAGIVAADSAELTGVAPDAKLIAYKVLNSGGNGWMSDIVAAIDRCVDPNQDGDLSDRVDVANLSLGGGGHPDDPPSRAVDNASLAGVVFAISAGNLGSPMSIGSPGTAARAITVGAADAAGARAIFSSQGPTALQYGIKPEVLAPGIDIVSTWRGGGYIPASGTSMASPHVAGVAALVRALHRDWTVEQIKSAIVSTAHASTDGAGVMAAGAGRVDALRAATATTETTPSLSFALQSGTTSTSSQRMILSVRNHSGAARTYSASTTGTREGIGLTITPSEVTIPPGQLRELEVVLEVDHSLVPFGENGDFAYGGIVELASGDDRLRVPWAFAKGLRVRFTYEAAGQPDALFAFLGRENSFPSFLPQIDENLFETLTMPGRHAAVVVASPLDPERAHAMIYFPLQDVQNDREFVARYSDAEHLTTFTPLDETGAPILAMPEREGCAFVRSVLLPNRLGAIQFAAFESWQGLRTNVLSDDVTLIASDVCMDPMLSRLYSVQYEPVHGVREDVHRTGGGSQFVSQKVELQFPPSPDAARYVGYTALPYVEGVYMGTGLSLSVPFTGDRWSGIAYLTPSIDTPLQYLPGIRAMSFGSRNEELASEPLHADAQGVASYASMTAPLNTYRGDVLAFGDGSVVPRLQVSSLFGEVYLSVPLFGQLEERRWPGLPFTGVVTDESGAVVGQGHLLQTDDLSRRLTLSISGETHDVDGQRGFTTFVTKFGGTEIDKQAPTITSMLLRDANGRRVAERVLRDGVTRMTFSVNDDHALDESKTRVRVRQWNLGSWLEVPVAIKSRENGTYAELGHEPRGTIYEAEMRLPATGPYDVEISVEDAAGNPTTLLIEPMIRVVEGRSRAARH